MKIWALKDDDFGASRIYLLWSMIASPGEFDINVWYKNEDSSIENDDSSIEKWRFATLQQPAGQAAVRAERWDNIADFCIKNEELWSKNDEFCIKNEELWSKNEEFCIKNEEFCMKNRERGRDVGDAAREGLCEGLH